MWGDSNGQWKEIDGTRRQILRVGGALFFESRLLNRLPRSGGFSTSESTERSDITDQITNLFSEDTTIEGFEDDLTGFLELQQDNPYDNWKLTTERDSVQEGTKALQYKGTGIKTEIVNINETIAYGNRIRFDFKPAGAWDSWTSFNFAQQEKDIDGEYYHFRYEVQLDPANNDPTTENEITLQYDDGKRSDNRRRAAKQESRTAGTSKRNDQRFVSRDDNLASIPFSFDKNQFYTLEIDWGATLDGLMLKILNPSTENVLGRVTVNEPLEAPSKGGIGFFGGGENAKWTYDNVRLVSTNRVCFSPSNFGTVLIGGIMLLAISAYADVQNRIPIAKDRFKMKPILISLAFGFLAFVLSSVLMNPGRAISIGIGVISVIAALLNYVRWYESE